MHVGAAAGSHNSPPSASPSAYAQASLPDIANPFWEPYNAYNAQPLHLASGIRHMPPAPPAFHPPVYTTAPPPPAQPSSGSDDEDPEDIPSEITELSRLRTFSLTCCDLEAIPPVIGRLSSLQSLILSGNRPHAMRHAFFFLARDMQSLCVRSTPSARHPPHPILSLEFWYNWMI